MDAVTVQEGPSGARAVATNGEIMEWYWITPRLAQTWLQKNANNWRLLKNSAASKMAAAIEDQGWRGAGEPIRFDVNGDLIDGQHRLAAIAKIGLTVGAWVCLNISDEDAVTIDSGRPRSFVQALEARGEKNYKDLASAVSYTWLYEHGDLSSVSSGVSGRTEIGPLTRCLEANPGLREAVDGSQAVRGVAIIGQVAMIWHVAASNGLQEQVRSFVDGIARGAGVSAGDSRYLLRERLLHDRTAKAKLSRREKLALTILAWNYWVAGRECRQLKWTSSGLKPQEFPTIATSAE